MCLKSDIDINSDDFNQVNTGYITYSCTELKSGPEHLSITSFKIQILMLEVYAL